MKFWYVPWMLFFVCTTAFSQDNLLKKIREKFQVGGADISAPMADQSYVCQAVADAGVYRFEFNTLSKKACVLKIPLGTSGWNLSQKSVLSFRIRGERDVQNFQIGLEASGRQEFAGAIYEFLPFSAVSQWLQTGIPLDIFEQKGLKLSNVTSLVLDFSEPAQGMVEIKEVASVAHLHPNTGWEVLILRKPEYGMRSMREFKTISLGHYGIEFGWKVGQVYKQEGAHAFAFDRIPLERLKSRAPAVEKGVFLLSDFDEGLQNSVGGYSNEFFKIPSQALMTFDRQVFRGGSGKSLRFRYQKKGDGYCGVWMHFFDMKERPLDRHYLDVRAFSHFSFWVKADRAGLDAAIQLADARWEKIEDSVFYGNISTYLPKGITPQWQQVVIPLNQSFYRNLNFDKLAALVLNVRSPSEGTIYIDDVVLSKSPIFDTPQRAPVSVAQPAKPLPKRYKAMWLWHTVKPLQSMRAQQELFSFCKKNAVNLIFFQLQYDLKRKENGTYLCTLRYLKELKAFLRNAHRLGIEVHALDGFSRFALKPWHEKVYATIRAVIDYNRRVSQDARFTGIHHDNEPYLIPYYWGGIQEEIMKDYLTLTQHSQSLVTASGLPNFVFGVDIPFWYEELNFDYEVPVELTWKGVRKPVSFHIIDMVDNVGIMDYRTKSYGADGTLVHGRDELEYAQSVNKKVLIGLETYPLPHEIFAVFRHHKEAALENLSISLRNNPRQLFMMVQDNEDLGILYVRRMRDDLKDTPMSLMKEILDLKLNKHKTIYGSDIAVDVPSTKLSFATLEADYFSNIYEETENYFSAYPSFAGMAIHYYETYKELMESKK